MAKLSDDEQKLLDQLQAKLDEPDDDRGGAHDLSVIVDLSDDNAVRRALRLGVLQRGDLDEFDDEPAGDDGDDGDDGDGGKGGKGGKGGGDDRSPRRRLSIADRAMGVDDE